MEWLSQANVLSADRHLHQRMSLAAVYIVASSEWRT